MHVIFEFMKSSGVGVERKYDKSWIQELNKQGYSCCGMDVQSKGRSEGFKKLRTYFETFDDVVKDDFAFVSKMPELGGEAFKADLPVFPFAVSMGGARAAMLLLRNQSLFKAALFYAPMLSLERVSKQGLNPYLRPLVNMFNLFGPTWRVAKASKNEMFPDLQEEFSNDFFSDQGRCSANWCRQDRTQVLSLSLSLSLCACVLIPAMSSCLLIPFLSSASYDTPIERDGARASRIGVLASHDGDHGEPGENHFALCDLPCRWRRHG